MAFQELFLGALAAALATSFGALGVLIFKKIGGKTYSALLSFSAGLMAYTAIEMLSESQEAAGDLMAFAGLVLGVVVILILERLIPHVHLWVRKKQITPEKKKVALVVGTVTLHNVPEGFAIASAFAGSTPLGWLVTAAISLQDIAEGFLISAPLACYGMEGKRCIKYGVLSGVVEFAAAIIGFLFLSIIIAATPIALSFSAGAMLFVIFVELLPDAFRKGMEYVAALSFFIGAALAFGLAVAIGF